MAMGVAYLQSWCALRRSACLSQCTTGVDCTYWPRPMPLTGIHRVTYIGPM